ncbi:hypothetical protein ACP275_08G159600 [Erythranthe tilingii]
MDTKCVWILLVLALSFFVFGNDLQVSAAPARRLLSSGSWLTMDSNNRLALAFARNAVSDLNRTERRNMKLLRVVNARSRAGLRSGVTEAKLIIEVQDGKGKTRYTVDMHEETWKGKITLDAFTRLKA